MLGKALFPFSFGGCIILVAVSDVLLSPNPLNSVLWSLDQEIVKTGAPWPVSAPFICAFVGNPEEVLGVFLPLTFLTLASQWMGSYVTTYLRT